MIKASSKVKLNMPQIRKLENAQIRALEMTGEALHTEVVQAQVVPRRDGALQGESFFMDRTNSKSGKVTLSHSTPYARRMYFHPEYKFHKEPWEETVTDKDGVTHKLTHDGNPNAKGLWFEDWLAGGSEQEFCKKAFAQIYRRLAGL